MNMILQEEEGQRTRGHLGGHHLSERAGQAGGEPAPRRRNKKKVTNIL